MAKKKEEAKIVLERIYNIPLRKELMKVPNYKRAKKAIIVIREFLKKHMKCDKVKLGKYLNFKVLEHGRKNIAHHIEVKAIKKDEIVEAELVGAPEEKKEEPKKEEVKETEKKEEVEKKETPKEERTKVLEKGLKKKGKPEKKAKFEDKEKGMMVKEEKIIGKTEKPKHERIKPKKEK